MAMNDNVNLFAAIQNLEIQEQAVLNRRKIYQKYDAFNVSDRQFMQMFRLNKELANNLIEIVTPFIREQRRTSALSPKDKVLNALNFFASGSYQLPVGKNLHLACSQSSVSRSVNEITNALNRPEIFNQWVRFPRNLQEMNSIRQQFFNKFEIPGVIGCLDCTHVAIFPPSRDDPVHPEHIFVNRKNYHSINTQLICDSTLKILHVNARFPGSCHDSHIWNNCNVEPHLRNLYNRGHEGYFLLGDSGYPLRPWLLTPLQNPHGENEEVYNRKHKRARATIEQCNGLLKMRFRCLLKHRVLHYCPQTSSKIINACTVLHNMCVENNLELILNEDEIQEDVDLGFVVNGNYNEDHIGRINPDLLAGRRMQRRIINRL